MLSREEAAKRVEQIGSDIVDLGVALGKTSFKYTAGQVRAAEQVLSQVYNDLIDTANVKDEQL